LNLIYVDTLQKPKIPMADLLPSETSFHGIVLGKPTYPLGVIHLDVIACCGMVDVNHHPVGNPKRKV
jgi:hypothetical protein